MTKQERYDYNKRYHKERIKRVPFDMQKEEYAMLKEFVTSLNLPVNTFIKMAIREKMEKHKEGAGNDRA